MLKKHSNYPPPPPLKILPINIDLPDRDVNGRLVSSSNEIVSLGTGTCCSKLLENIYRMAYDARSSNIVFLISSNRQKPSKHTFGRFAIAGKSVPSPGYYVKNLDRTYTMQDFPNWLGK